MKTWSCAVVGLLMAPLAGTAFAQQATIYPATAANIIVMQEPGLLDGGDGHVIQSLHVAGWTADVTDVTAANLKLLQYPADGAHLGNSPSLITVGGLMIPAPLSNYEVGVNQPRHDLSVKYFAPPQAFEPVQAWSMPPGGDYVAGFRVEWASSHATANVRYRIDGGPIQVYSPGAGPWIWKDTVLEYFATNGGDTGSTKTEVYRIHRRGDLDSDGDGIPDFVELDYGLDPGVPLSDTDGEGWDDLDELVRGSNPRIFSSTPMDSDGDEWSDYDEGVRGTDMNNPDDHPTARGVNLCEYIMDGQAIRQATGSVLFSDGSTVRVTTLAGKLIASATIMGGSFHLRVPGDRPMFVRVVEYTNHNLGVLLFVPECELCINRRALYTEGMTATQWVNAYRMAYEADLVHLLLPAINAETTARALLLARLFQTTVGFTTPLYPGNSDGDVDGRDFLVWQRNYGSTALLAYLDGGVEHIDDWEQATAAFMEDVDGSSMKPMLDILVDAEYGLPIDPALLPMGVSPSGLSMLVALNEAALDAAPSRVVDGSGILQLTLEGEYEAYDPYHNFNFRVNFDQAVGPPCRPPGSIITFTGLEYEDCDYPGLPAVQLIEYSISDVPLDENMLDSEPDGLPDQWENFFFGHLGFGPNDDPDGDFSSNTVELGNHTDPSDGSSGGMTPTPTPTATSTPVATNTPTRTPSPTATPTATVTSTFTSTPTPTITNTPGPNPYDLDLNLVINTKDLLILIDLSADVNKDGMFDYMDLLDFSLNYQLPIVTPTPTPTSG